MNLGSVIQQIRTYVPSLGARVAGVADFANGLENVANLPMPAAFVYPLEDEAGPNDDENGLQQVVTESIGITVQFDNTLSGAADARTGYAGANQIDAMRLALFKAVLNWRPDDLFPPTAVGPAAARGFRYTSGRLLDFDRARLFWQFVFSIDVTISDADGFPLDGPPLEVIQAQVVTIDGKPQMTFQVTEPE